MRNRNQLEDQRELMELCTQIRELIPKNEYEKCEKLLCMAMQKHPHAPHPHNLYGLLFEAQGDHRTAMKHFRAACALDATYVPTQYNLKHFGTFYSWGKWAYDESDCPDEQEEENYESHYDTNGIGRIVKEQLIFGRK